MNNDDLLTLARWCDGTLDEAALAAWDARLRADPTLAAAVAAELRLENGLRALNEPTARQRAAARTAATRTQALLAADRSSRRERTVSAVMAVARPRWRRWWPVLAGAAALAVSVVWWWPQDTAVAWGDDRVLAAGAEVPPQVRTLRFADGSTVAIAPDSRVRLGSDRVHKDLHLDHGSVSAAVTTQTSGSFAISTAHGTARVRGTRFDLALADDSTLLSVSEGRVTLQAGGHALDTVAGGRALAADGEVQQLPPVWRDRRPLGRLVLSGAPASAINGNGWLFDAGLDQRGSAFAQRLTDEIDRGLAAVRRSGGQGLLLYAIEGGAAQTGAGFVGDPRRLAELAPEFDAIADTLFARIGAAGMTSGLTITPWRLTRDGDRWRQVADPAGAEKELLDKLAYARRRWGCTLFYINVASPGLPPDIRVPPAALRAVVRTHPDVLLIVENPGRAHAAIAGVQVLGRDAAIPGDLVIRLPWLGDTPDRTSLDASRARGEITLFDARSADQAADLGQGR